MGGTSIQNFSQKEYVEAQGNHYRTWDSIFRTSTSPRGSGIGYGTRTPPQQPTRSNSGSGLRSRPFAREQSPDRTHNPTRRTSLTLNHNESAILRELCGSSRNSEDFVFGSRTENNDMVSR